MAGERAGHSFALAKDSSVELRVAWRMSLARKSTGWLQEAGHSEWPLFVWLPASDCRASSIYERPFS